jgi:hypothetical protein
MWFLHLEGIWCFQTKNGLTKGELQELQKQLCLPMDEDIEFHPVVLVVFFVNHYFVVVVDYVGDAMYVFGRHTAEHLAGVNVQGEEDWRAWRGHFLWTHLRKLFQWDEEGCSLVPGVILAVNWPQVSDKLLPKPMAEGEALGRTVWIVEPLYAQ